MCVDCREVFKKSSKTCLPLRGGGEIILQVVIWMCTEPVHSCPTASFLKCNYFALACILFVQEKSE